MIRQFILALAALATVSATPWNTTVIDVGEEAGSVSASAVDAAGRVHFFSVTEDPGVAGFYELNHTVRASGSSGLSSFSFASVPGAERPRSASMVVTDDFRVQVAVLTAVGSVDVWERVDEDGAWVKTVVGAGSVDPFAGVDLEKSRGANTSRSALVFTSASGGVRFCEQLVDGGWSLPETVSAGGDTGLSPVLVHTGFGILSLGIPSRVVVSYNRAENRIETNRFGVGRPDRPMEWSSAVEVAPAFTPTRLDAVGYAGRVGVALVSNGDSGTASQIVRVQYAEREYGVSESMWRREDVALGGEADEDEDEFFGWHAGLAFDAVGEPMVGYQRVLARLGELRTLDIRVRRHVPGLGWKLDVVEELPVAGVGTYMTDFLGLTSGVNGDPVLTYERDSGAVSEFVFARPVAAPWTLGRPESLADFGYSSAPAMCTSDSGSVHLVTNVGTLRSFFGAPTAQYKAPLVTTFHSGVVTSEQLPAPDGHHFACGIAADGRGAVHVVALRQSAAEEGTLHYYRREAGGVFVEIGDAIPTGGAVERKPISVGAADDGRVFVAYHPTGGGIRIDSYDPASDEWGVELFFGADGIDGMDLAVREDGEFALTYFSYSAGGIAGSPTMLSTVEPSTGRLIVGLDRIEFYTVESDLALTANTSCAFGVDGRPRFAYLNAGVITLARPDADAATEFSLTKIEPSIGEGLPDLIELAHGGGTAHIVAGTTDGGGGLRYYRLPAGGSFTGNLVVETGLGMNRTSEVGSSPRDPIALTLDKFGEPVVGIATTEPAIAGATVERVVVARPADFIDADGDGFPLLEEEAHGLDDTVVNRLAEAPRRNIVVHGEFTEIRHLFDVPLVPLRSTSSGVAFGEFEYVNETSYDLVDWAPLVDPTPAGISQTIFGPEPGGVRPNTSVVGFNMLFEPALMAGNPRFFTRLRVRRGR